MLSLISNLLCWSRYSLYYLVERSYYENLTLWTKSFVVADSYIAFVFVGQAFDRSSVVALMVSVAEQRLFVPQEKPLLVGDLLLVFTY